MSNTATAPTPDTNNTTKPKRWRDQLPIHPAAELFPLMSEPELRELGENIKANGLLEPISIEGKKLLDGRNRLDAIELVGMKLKFTYGRRGPQSFIIGMDSDDFTPPLYPVLTLNDTTDDYIDPYVYVISKNIHRRHLTPEQKRELIAKLLKAKPEQSDRQIAKQTKASPTTVGKIRNQSEATGDVSKLDTRIDAKGRKQRAHKPGSDTPPKRPSKPQTIDVRDQVNSFARRSVEFVQQFVNELGEWLAHHPPLDDEAKSALVNAFHVCAEEFDRIAEHIDPTGKACRP
jgi:ParB-like chromosome segregation protein Spo0J